MKNEFLLRLLLLLFLTGSCYLLHAQTAGIKGKLEIAPYGKMYLIRPGFPFHYNNTYQGWRTIPFNEKGKFNVEIDLPAPEIIKLVFYDSASKHIGDYNLYLKPGDKINIFTADSKMPPKYKITGTAPNDNQPLVINGFADSIWKFRGDTVPDRVITYLQKQNGIHKETLEKYIKQYNPTAGFVTAWKANLQYEVLDAYFGFATNNAYQIDEAYDRNFKAWNSINGTLFKDAPINNEQALVAANYKNFIKTYVSRTKEKLWDLFRTQRSAFLQEWYTEDTLAGAIEYVYDQSNDFQRRIIEKTFTGKQKEYLLATLINDAMAESQVKNLVSIYEAFAFAYPESSYLKYLKNGIEEVKAKMKRAITSDMKFIDGAALFTKWEDIVAHYKGQTMLIDMWGTWCGPCRQDMDKHGAYIKSYFKGRPLTYLYIANGDTGKEKLWKELIAYFNLSGEHFISPKELTKDIMAKVKGRGYPTYIILNKDGQFELYDRGYGIDRKQLTAQIEKALLER